MRLLITLCVLLSCKGVVLAQISNDLLISGHSVEFLEQNILDPAEWVHYPNIEKHQEWESLIPKDKYDAQIRKAESYIGYEWPVARASVFLEYVTTGNRQNFERISFSRRNALSSLVIGELIEGKGRFTNDLVDGIWSICEETFWGVPAHLSYQKKGNGLADVNDPVVDLFAAETASILAWTSYLLGDKLDVVSPLLTERIYIEINRRIFKVLESDPKYRWMGYGRENVDTTLPYSQRSFLQRRPNNWNPWISSNVLSCVLLLEKNRQRRADIVYQVFEILDNYLNPYPADGGCDEGTSYWGRAAASVFDCLDLISGSTSNKINIFDQGLIKNMGEFIAKAYVSDGYYINFADAHARVNHSPMLVYRYGKAVNSRTMTEMGAFLAQESNFSVAPSDGYSLLRILPELYYSKELLGIVPKEPLVQDVWLPDIQVMVSRDNAESAKGLYLAAKAGNNEESHNHNDVGSFIVYLDGKPALIDVGAGTYTANYSKSWVKKSEFHNLLPVINGKVQLKGSRYAAKNVQYFKDPKKVILIQDIAGTYGEEAGVIRWKRTFTHRKGKSIEIVDNYELEKPDPIFLPLMVLGKPELFMKGEIRINQGAGQFLTIKFDSRLFEAEIEKMAVEDMTVARSWGDILYRVQFKMITPSKKGSYTFLIE